MLDRRTPNRSLLARQFLLDRVDAPALEVVERLVGIQAQVPLDPHIGRWSRLRAFDPGTVGEAVLERCLVRMTLPRTTLHLVSADDALALRPVLQDAIARAFVSSPFARRLEGLDLDPVIARGVELVERQALTLSALAAGLVGEWPRFDADSLADAVRYLVPSSRSRRGASGGRTLQPKVTTLRSWLGRPLAAVPSADELVVPYLRAFGPATDADVRAWSWLRDVGPVLDRLAPRLRVYRDERGRVLYGVAAGVFCDGSAPAPVRFLPQYDNVFTAYAERGRIMDASAGRPRLHGSGRSSSTDSCAAPGVVELRGRTRRDQRKGEPRGREVPRLHGPRARRRDLRIDAA